MYVFMVVDNKLVRTDVTTGTAWVEMWGTWQQVLEPKSLGTQYPGGAALQRSSPNGLVGYQSGQASNSLN